MSSGHVPTSNPRSSSATLRVPLRSRGKLGGLWAFHIGRVTKFSLLLSCCKRQRTGALKPQSVTSDWPVKSLLCGLLEDSSCRVSSSGVRTWDSCHLHAGSQAKHQRPRSYLQARSFRLPPRKKHADLNIGTPSSLPIKEAMLTARAGYHRETRCSPQPAIDTTRGALAGKPKVSRT